MGVAHDVSTSLWAEVKAACEKDERAYFFGLLAFNECVPLLMPRSSS
jgi:hypothetical protein